MVHGAESTGGTEGLAGLIDDYGEAIEADLQEYFGLDLLDVFRPDGRLTPGKVLRLLSQLGVESRTVAEMAGNRDLRGWTQDRAILADLWDLIAAVNTPPKKRRPRYPRPGGRRRIARVADLPGAVRVE